MNSERPLSPHLQVYKWQLSSLLSITHRMTSIFNFAGISFFTLWIFSLLMGEKCFSYFQGFASTIIAKFVFVGFTWSFSYHLLNGIRHLIWDMGYGYELKIANVTGILVLTFSFILTLLIWI
jgi:succinate dehydrogenase / fumarate reductase cytochrome b subunit